MVRQGALCLAAGPKSDTIQPWAQQGWGLWQTSEHWASLMVFLQPHCLCWEINSNSQKLKQVEWHADFPISVFQFVGFFFSLLFFFLVVLSGVKQTNNQTKSWLILGGRGMTAAWFHQWELCSRLHQSLVLSAWGRRDHAALLETRKSCNPSSEYQTLGCWKGLIIGPELTKFNGSRSFSAAIPGSWSSLYQHF